MDFAIGSIASGAVIGGVIGFLTGVFGIGGGFLLTPLLLIVMGVVPQVAVATGLAVIFLNSTYGLYARRGSGTIDIKLSLVLSLGSIVGVLAGAFLLARLSALPQITVLGRQQNPAHYTLLVVFVVLLAGIASFLYSDIRRHGDSTIPIRVGLLSHLRLPPYGHFPMLEVPRLSLPSLIAMGLVVGLLTGLLGVGGGVVLLPALVYLVGLRAVKAAGTSMLLVWITSLTGVVRMSGGGHISRALLLVLLAGGFAGTWIGTKVGLTLQGRSIRLYFVFVVLAAFLLVAWELLKLTFL